MKRGAKMSKKYYFQVLLETDDISIWNTLTEVNKAQATLLQGILYEHALSFMKQLKDTIENIVDDIDAIKEMQEVLCEEDDDDDTLIIPEYDIQEIDISKVRLKAGLDTLPVIPFITFQAKISTEELQKEMSEALETVSGILERQDFTELVETTRYRVVEVQSDNNLNQPHHNTTKHLKSEQPKKIYPFW